MARARALLLAINTAASLSLLAGARAAQVLAATPSVCTSDLNCHLNGRCTRGRCACESAWTGPTCGSLALQPVNPLQMGFAERNATSQTTSWGGNAVQGDDGKWHMFVSEIANGCSLKDWTTNSQVSFWTNPSCRFCERRLCGRVHRQFY